MESFSNILQQAFPAVAAPKPGETVIRAAAADPVRQGQIKVVQTTQYALYVAFQALSLALATAVTVSLIVAIWRLTAHPDNTQAILGGVVVLGDIVGGVATGFVQNQANAAKKRYEDTQRLLSAA